MIGGSTFLDPPEGSVYLRGLGLSGEASACQADGAPFGPTSPDLGFARVARQELLDCNDARKKTTRKESCKRTAGNGRAPR